VSKNWEYRIADGDWAYRVITVSAEEIEMVLEFDVSALEELFKKASDQEDKTEI
jgi:hypothetical protein